jgi:hypothetical protein
MKKIETQLSPEHWKRKLAMAIGRPELASAPDEELEAAHDEHELEVRQELVEGGDYIMPPGPASVVNSAPSVSAPPTLANAKQRSEYLQGLVREVRQKQGISHDAAYNHVRTLHPELFSNSAPVGGTLSKKQLASLEQRREEIAVLVNQKMETNGVDYDEAFFRVQRDNPQLFPNTEKP